MSDANYWRQLYGMRESEFVNGFKAGIEAYAYWKDGTQYVGTSGKTLEEALKEVDEAFETGKES